jgi:hypothetical protein
MANPTTTVHLISWSMPLPNSAARRAFQCYGSTPATTVILDLISKRMAEAFRAAGGNVEYHLLSDFGGDGHFLIDSADAVQLWAPIVSEFLAKHR